jgi:trypsin-like peptidase
MHTSIKFIFFVFVSFMNMSAFCSSRVRTIEDLQYTTLQIKSFFRSGSSTGTGFLYKEGQELYLVTNKHVVQDLITQEYASIGVINFHTIKGGRLGKYQYKFSPLEDDPRAFGQEFIYHSSSDLCKLALTPYIQLLNTLYQQSESLNNDPQYNFPSLPPTKIFYKYLDQHHIPDFSTQESFQEILMVGYPIGLSDEVNNLPLFRKGITASALKNNFQGKPEFVIDAACFPGSSGSPVFIYPTAETSMHFGGGLSEATINNSVPKLIGILWGGLQHDAQGQIICNSGGQPVPCPIPGTFNITRIPINLGYVIKAREISHIIS